MSKERETSLRGRDAKSGEFIPVKDARNRPTTTVVERVPLPGNVRHQDLAVLSFRHQPPHRSAVERFGVLAESRRVLPAASRMGIQPFHQYELHGRSLTPLSNFKWTHYRSARC